LGKLKEKRMVFGAKGAERGIGNKNNANPEGLCLQSSQERHTGGMEGLLKNLEKPIGD